MGSTLIRNHFSQFIQLLLIFSIGGALLLPPLRISSNLPAFELSDIVFPILTISLLFCYKNRLVGFVKSQRLITIGFGAFILLTFFSIIYNCRWREVRDWFEFFKYVKFFVFIISFYLFLSRKQIIKLMSVLFIGVFVFNILHYFNIFNFNEIIEVYYAPPHHLDAFGLNSIGEPSTKRALGTLGNPNTNAIIFLLFIVLFLIRNNKLNYFHLGLLVFSILGIFLCQSRTGFLTFVVLILTYFLTSKVNWKIALGIIVLSTSYYFLFNSQGNVYIDSIGNAESMQKASEGRLYQWRKIFNSMPNNWIFGHAPYKEYFEKHDIYSESEYFLILFRYGIAGLAAFLTFWFLWFKKYALPFKMNFNLGLYTLIIYLMTAITNNPLQSPKIALILGVIMALTLLETDERKEEG